MLRKSETEFSLEVQDVLSLLVTDADRRRPGFRVFNHLEQIVKNETTDPLLTGVIAILGDKQAKIDQFKFPLARAAAIMMMAEDDGKQDLLAPGLREMVAEKTKTLAAIMGKTLPSQALVPAS